MRKEINVKLAESECGGYQSAAIFTDKLQSILESEYSDSNVTVTVGNVCCNTVDCADDFVTQGQVEQIIDELLEEKTNKENTMNELTTAEKIIFEKHFNSSNVYINECDNVVYLDRDDNELLICGLEALSHELALGQYIDAIYEIKESECEKIDNDYNEEETTYHFDDGSYIKIDSFDSITVSTK